MLPVLAAALGLSTLPLDPSRLAILDPGHSRSEVLSALATEGLVNIHAWAIPGWWIVDVPASQQDATETLVDRIVHDGRVAFVSPVHLGADGGAVFATPDLLVGFAHGEPAARVEAALRELPGFTIVDKHFGAMENAFRLHALAHDARSVVAAAELLAARADVLFAEPDMVFTGHGAQLPNDPLYPDCWALDNTGQLNGTPDVDLDAPEAWQRTRGNPSIITIIIDSGVELAHPDLAANMVSGADLTSDGPGVGLPVNAFDSHGTPVAGCLVGVFDNNLGGVGVAPDCRAASARTFITTLPDGTWTSQSSWTVDALAFAQSIGARITNNSNVYGFSSMAIAQKYLDTWNAGLVHFAATGNAGQSAVSYPANIPTVNAVGSLDRNGLLSPTSNTGVGIDFVAPGEDIATTDRVGALGWDITGDYVFASGTSFSAPFAAGVAALLLSVDPTLSSAQVEQLMHASCTDLGAPGYDTTFGYGFVNAFAALQLACGQPTNFCTTSPNTVGPGALMGFGGTQSIAANDLVLLATGCPRNTYGIFYLGTQTSLAPFGNGVRCVGGAVLRWSVVVTSAAGDASQPIDLTTLPAGQGVVAGSVRYFQLWYRNPGAGGMGFNLSDGLEVHFCP
jgi:hypothetical protein